MIRYRVKGTDNLGKAHYWTPSGGWAGLESAGAFTLRYARGIITDQRIRNRYLDLDERVEASLEKI
jgi:hypothetical protein